MAGKKQKMRVIWGNVYLLLTTLLLVYGIVLNIRLTTSLTQECDFLLFSNRIKLDLDSQVEPEPTSEEPMKTVKEEQYFDSFEDPVNYWDESWYFWRV